MTEHAPPATPQPAFRRKVFYIPGYDPIPPRRYRELYRTEGKAQAEISGYSLALQPRGGGGPYGWRVQARMPDQPPVEAEVEVLVWSDIVSSSMKTGIVGTYLQLVRTAGAYILSGALFRLMRLRKGPMIAALYPIGVLLLQLAVSLGLGFLAAKGVFWAANRVRGLVEVLAMDNIPPVETHWAAPALHLAIVAAVTFITLTFFRARDHKIYAWYLMHDYAYSAQSLGANPPGLETRITAFAQRLRESLADCDEVLVVGHSSGAHLAVSILSDLLRQGIPQTPALSLLTLGQVVPMVSFLPRAQRLRGDLAFLSAQDRITWVDVTAPGDGCAFALCDPVSVTGVAPRDKRWPLVISAAFTQTLSPEKWRALRWRFFRLHFQYLCAFDRPGDYDYFQITAGPLTLGQRYQGRAASKSRIETPLSGWRST
ncbi:hypothetical protein [Stagnihabitans tardus]|uniref:Uncharacterized protein n=1 Tax=Stagnihabitans tardus TaxID=2699202 RepID=A0AAE4Y8B5_9RHOB|nr:hypothetical protein [Stagnihabitans tardus]NBZ87841.1 hypothetical protein [Stagnihabitans tardus]